MADEEQAAEVEEEPWWANKQEDELDIQVRKAKERQSKPRRFYLPVGVNQPVTFFTEVPHKHWEHNWKEDGSWRNWGTCSDRRDKHGNVANIVHDPVMIDGKPVIDEETGEVKTVARVSNEKTCKRCLGGNNAYLAHTWVVCDHSEWEDREDNVHKDEPRLMVAKPRSASRIKAMAKKRKGIKGCQFDVGRSSDKSPNTGDTFDFTEKFTLAKQKAFKWWPDAKKNPELLNPPWAEWFKPEDPAEAAASMNQTAEAAADEEEPSIGF